jgi:hypothetical protein
MLYGAIRRYRIRTGSVNEIVESVKTGLVPLLEKMPGFTGYYIINGESNVATSFTVGESHEQVAEMNRVAIKWVTENLPDRLGAPEVIAGPVPVALTHQHV